MKRREFLKAGIGIAAMGALKMSPMEMKAKGNKPNVIFILADDIGWGDLQCYGNPYVETPNLNELASKGMLFTDYYSPSALCAPARAGIMTGRYNHRTGAIDVSSNRAIDRMALSEKTIGDYFKKAGYKTGYIGKWHNGLYNLDYHPNERGFDYFYGYLNGGQDYYKWHINKNGKTIDNDGSYLTNTLNEEAVDYVEKNKDNPFFLILSHAAIHFPLQAPDEITEKYMERVGEKWGPNVAKIYAMTEIMDKGLGELFDKLDELGLKEDTIVVFTSDNGGWTYKHDNLKHSHHRYEGPFRGCKGIVLEEGIRVPAIVSWPGKVQEGKVCRVPVHGCDWLPTLYSVTKEKTPKGAKKIDGVNIMPLLKGKKMPELNERDLYFQKTRYTPVDHSDSCIRRGPWKLYWPGVPETMEKQGDKDNPFYFRGCEEPHWEMPADTNIPSHEGVETYEPKLYNLIDDPSERHDLSDKYPELVKEMGESYDRWFKDVMADWRKSWQEIKKQEKEYWKGRKKPDKEALIKDYRR